MSKSFHLEVNLFSLLLYFCIFFIFSVQLFLLFSSSFCRSFFFFLLFAVEKHSGLLKNKLFLTNIYDISLFQLLKAELKEFEPRLKFEMRLKHC